MITNSWRMKNRLFLLGLVSLLVMLTSCSSYYYSVVSASDGKGERDRRRDFVEETDSVRISYSFNGEDAPVSITIYNKLNEPLFVDWTRSALIIDDVATSYHDAKATVQGETESETYRWSHRWSDSYSSFAGEFTLPKGVDFIPPKSKVEKTPLKLTNFQFDRIPNEEYQKSEFPTSNAGTKLLLTKEFTPEDTPLSFRSYLTLYTADKEGKPDRVATFERSFFVSKLLKTGNVPPTEFREEQRFGGDFFYVHKVKGKQAGLIIGTVAAATAVVAVSVAIGGDVDTEDF